MIFCLSGYRFGCCVGKLAGLGHIEQILVFGHNPSCLVVWFLLVVAAAVQCSEWWFESGCSESM